MPDFRLVESSMPLLIMARLGFHRDDFPGAVMSVAKFTTIAIIGFMLAACAEDSGADKNAGTGTLIGSGAGAPAGGLAATGGTGKRSPRAVISALLGGLIGNRIDAALDDEDKQRAYAAQLDALDRAPAGAPRSWENPESGRHGTVVPGPAYQQAGRNCRAFTHTIYINERPQTARRTACQNPDGSWSAVG
ncbi:MAG: RT0821/Lpp0805 family surface protein [Pseudolabrys sp.]